MAVKVNGAFTGGLLGAGAGVAWAGDLATMAIYHFGLAALPPDVLAAWNNVLTGVFGLFLTAGLAVASKLVSPYLVEKGDEKSSTVAAPGA